MACSDIAYNKLRGGAVIDTAGNVWATSDATNVVYKFNGTTTTTIPVSGATFTYGIAADGKGNVFFTDPSGLKLYELPSSATATTVPTLIGPVATSSPYQIAVDSKGTVVVAQSGASGTTSPRIRRPQSADPPTLPPARRSQTQRLMSERMALPSTPTAASGSATRLVRVERPAISRTIRRLHTAARQPEILTPSFSVRPSIPRQSPPAV